MQGFGNRSWCAGITLAVVLVIAGCAAPRGPAPVEDRGTMTRAPGAAPGGPLITTDGKPGYYTVRSGDTIRRIGNETGQSWQNIVRWNNLENPDLIEVGQVLRVIPPVGPASGATSLATAPAPADGVVTKPVAPPSAVVPTAPASAAAGKPPVTASPSAPASNSADEDLGWIWPAHGTLIAGFDDAKNKGFDIGGKAGDAVLAAADGRVVYAGAGLRGYGNLIILKHNNTYLTAYAHNQTLLVKEDQSVQKGQKIAEMGNSDADRVKLHFEIRRQGKPVDPARYLPSR